MSWIWTEVFGRTTRNLATVFLMQQLHSTLPQYDKLGSGCVHVEEGLGGLTTIVNVRSE